MGKKRPEAFCKKMSESRKGAGNPMYGRHLSDEHKAKLRASWKPQTDETRARISEGMKRYHREHPRTEETKQKISIARRGKRRPYNLLRLLDVDMIKDPRSLSQIKSDCFRGIPLKEEHRKKISAALKGNPFTEDHKRALRGTHCGEKSGAWKGGVSFEPYCPKFNKEFRERVRNFFGRRCVVCGKDEIANRRRLSVHHVNHDKNTCCNGSPRLFVALCGSCHSIAENNIDYWEEQFTTMIEEDYGGLCYLPRES